MATYIIGYDLLKPGQDYSRLISEIKRLCPTHWHCLDSTWIVDYVGGAAKLRDTLTPYIDRNDRLLVARLSGEAAWTGFSVSNGQWLKDRLEKQSA